MSRAAALAAIGLALSVWGCRRESVARSIDRPGADHPGGRPAGAARLPEDPVAGKRSEAQWREHMAAEEHERQLGYDRRKLQEHRALVKLLRAARARYDRARTPAAVRRAQAAVAPMLETARGRVTAIDHWGVSSALLGDYAAFIAALAGPYPDARRAAVSGDASALATLRADLDRRTKKIGDWLNEAAASEDE